jgi:heme-degrading monooxygenase HmoA
MIARQWKGYAAQDRADEYVAHLRNGVLPQLKSLYGFRGASLGRRSVGGEVELLVTTLWDSMEAVRAFAGDKPDVAVVEPAARAVLKRFEETVAHYDVVLNG